MRGRVTLHNASCVMVRFLIALLVLVTASCAVADPSAFERSSPVVGPLDKGMVEIRPGCLIKLDRPNFEIKNNATADYRLVWSGACQDGFADGFGELLVIFEAHGLQARRQGYVGFVKTGYLSGFGVREYSSGSVYKGEFEKSKKHGFGVFTRLSTGAKCELFKASVRAAGEECHQADHQSFIGLWREGAPETGMCNFFTANNSFVSCSWAQEKFYDGWRKELWHRDEE